MSFTEHKPNRKIKSKPEVVECLKSVPHEFGIADIAGANPHLKHYAVQMVASSAVYHNVAERLSPGCYRKVL